MKESIIPCPVCNGTGKVRNLRAYQDGFIEIKQGELRPCVGCKGEKNIPLKSQFAAKLKERRFSWPLH
jgi:DnaJ-class molecular chaperone